MRYLEQSTYHLFFPQGLIALGFKVTNKMDRQERMKIEKEKASHIRYLIDKAETIKIANSGSEDEI